MNPPKPPSRRPVPPPLTIDPWQRFISNAVEVSGIKGWTDPNELVTPAGKALAAYLRGENR